MTPDKAMQKALLLMEEFRSVSPELGAQTIATFLIVASNPGCTVTDVVRLLGLTLSSASRNVIALSTRKHKGEEGFGLIDHRQDMNDFRRKTLHLTPAGARVVNHVVSILS